MNKTKSAFRLFLSIILFSLPASLQAQSTGHYVGGLEGIRGASLPPPGWYVRDYNLFYHSSRVNDVNGNRISVADPEIFNYANAPRLVWISDAKILGGSIGLDALVPLVYQSVRVTTPAGLFDDSTFGLGDVFAEATLSWHVPHFDLSMGAGCWAPTGDSAAPPSTLAGGGFWTPMFTAGATWYIDAEKSWSVSALSRYEVNTEQEDTGIRPGQVYTLEWGVAKTFNKVFDLGVVGYYQRQTTSGNVNGSNKLGTAAAIGPEVGIAVPQASLSISLRYLYEFVAEERAQGRTFTLTVTKRL